MGRPRHPKMPRPSLLNHPCRATVRSTRFPGNGLGGEAYGCVRVSRHAPRGRCRLRSPLGRGSEAGPLVVGIPEARGGNDRRPFCQAFHESRASPGLPRSLSGRPDLRDHHGRQGQQNRRYERYHGNCRLARVSMLHLSASPPAGHAPSDLRPAAPYIGADPQNLRTCRQTMHAPLRRPPQRAPAGQKTACLYNSPAMS